LGFDSGECRLSYDDVVCRRAVDDEELVVGHRIGKNHIYRTSSVDQYPTYIVIGDFSSNDHRVIVGVNDPFFLFFTKGDGLPTHLRELAVPIGFYADDLRVMSGTYILFHRSVRGSRQSGASADGADHVDLPIRIWGWCLRWSGNVLVQLSFPNQAFDDLPQTNAVFGAVAVLLVISAELAGIPIVLPIGLSVWFRDLVVFVH
ncbi:unnamed protein product, partial [Prunus brigantina]